MILKFLVQLLEFSPWLRRKAWHRWYQYLAGYSMQEWRFMNYGYVSVDESGKHAVDPSNPPIELEPDDEEERLPIQLYHYVAGQSELTGKNVLEVGCGRGGGASFVSRYHHPRQMTAVDFSKKAIQICQKNLGTSQLEYVHGNAESLPFDDRHFDAVVNVESSHCYGSMPKFLAQVHRVLKPGGHFLFADFRAADALPLLEQQLAESGLVVIDQTDITANVLESMRLDNDRKLKLIDQWTGKRINGTIRQFAGVDGSEIQQMFKNGDVIYIAYHIKKPATDEAG